MASPRSDFTAPEFSAPVVQPDHSASQAGQGTAMPLAASDQSAPRRRAPLPRDPASEHFPTRALDDGRAAWALGLLALAALPLLAALLHGIGRWIILPLAAALLPGIAMLIAGLMLSRRNRVARVVGLRAATFGAAGITLTGLLLLALSTVNGHETGSFDEAFNRLVLFGAVAILTTVLYPLTAIVLAIMALTRPVTPGKAARILDPR